MIDPHDEALALRFVAAMDARAADLGRDTRLVMALLLIAIDREGVCDLLGEAACARDIVAPDPAGR